jgi:PPOX class probable F420-dependent enzyme
MTQTTETATETDLLALFGERGNGTLMTVQPDGRPQASVVSYAFDRATRTLRISVTESRVKTRNLRRDARASFMVVHPEMHSWVVGEGTAALTPPAAAPDDPTTEAMVALFREVMGEHPDWPGFRAAMVAERRVVVTIPVDHIYGLTGATT